MRSVSLFLFVAINPLYGKNLLCPNHSRLNPKRLGALKFIEIIPNKLLEDTLGAGKDFKFRKTKNLI